MSDYILWDVLGYKIWIVFVMDFVRSFGYLKEIIKSGVFLKGPNILLDDCLPSKADKNLLNAVKNSIVQGF
ncbi:hypothetical protein C5167_041402 [Papaver somniferum]|nr:hypothetical protein C5167_041402 [Papaver somniferum]